MVTSPATDGTSERPRRRAAVAALVALMLLWTVGGASGQSTADPSEQPTPTPTPQAADASGQETGGESGSPQPRPPWIKRLRAWAHHTVSGSAAWFDGLFGDERVDDEVYVSRGWLTGFVAWDEENGVKPGLRLRARFVFPQMERKLGILVGRGDPDDQLSSTDPGGGGLDRLPGSDNDTVAGLEYVPLEGTGSRLSFSAGARIASPLDPYVRGRYRRLFPVGEDALIRFRQTVFWRNTKGFGTTSAVDIERRRSQGLLLRWSLAGTVSEVSDGVEVDTGLTVYHALGVTSALAWHGWVAGETGAPVPTREFGVDVAYRQRLWWPWLIGELRTGRAWRREEVADRRHGVWLAGVGLEMQLASAP